MMKSSRWCCRCSLHAHHTITDAYDKWTTGFYDYIQFLQNAIPK